MVKLDGIIETWSSKTARGLTLASRGDVCSGQCSRQAQMVLDQSLVMWFSISAHGLASARDWKMCFGQFSRPKAPVKVVLTMSKLVSGVVPTARRLLLRHRGTLQVRCSIVKDGGDFVWTSIMRRLSSDPECLFHKLVQSLDGVIELCRGLPEVF
jgi:hypothetical protein